MLNCRVECPKETLQARRKFRFCIACERPRGNYVAPQMASRRVLVGRVRQIWPGSCANFLGMWAARVQMASGRWVEWTGQIARQDAAGLARTRRQRRYGRQQGLRIGMARLGEQPIGGRALDDAAEIHDGNARRDMLHHRQIVADEDVGEAKPLLQVLKQVQDLSCESRRRARTPARRRRSASAPPPVRGRWRCAGAGRPRTRADSAGRVRPAARRCAADRATRSRRLAADRRCAAAAARPAISPTVMRGLSEL